MKLFTSIRPPSTRDELTYLQQCITSWRAAGFQPISINGPKEIKALQVLDLRIELMPMAADGKPRIDAILEGIRKTGVRFAGLINSDCRIVSYSGLLGHLEARLDRAAVVGWRIDVDSGLRLTSQRGGFDAFFFDTEILPEEDRGFTIGELWWDHWFPLACEMRGARIETIAAPLLLHKDHPGSTRGFIDSGLKLWSALQAWHRRGDMPESLLARLPAIDRTPTYDELCQLTRITPRWLLDYRPQRFPLMDRSAIDTVLRLCGTAFLSYGQAETLRAEVEMLRNSTSWRITQPLRHVAMTVRKFRQYVIGSAHRNSHAKRRHEKHRERRSDEASHSW
jgi:hypothetical protein